MGRKEGGHRKATLPSRMRSCLAGEGPLPSSPRWVDSCKFLLLIDTKVISKEGWWLFS